MVLLIEGKLFIEKIRDDINGFRRRMTGGIHGYPGVRRHFKQVFRQLVIAGENNTGHFESHEVFKLALPVLFIEMVQEPGFGIAEDLNTLVGEEVCETGKCKARPVQITLENPAFLFVYTVQTAQFDVVLPADIVDEICNRDGSLFQSLLFKVHGLGNRYEGNRRGNFGHLEASGPEENAADECAVRYYSILSLCF
jgi:hypothetical protein